MRFAAVTRTMEGAKADDLESDLKALEQLTRVELASRWHDLLGSVPPKGISQRLLLSTIAYTLQAKQYGGLAAATRRQLDSIAAAPSSADPPALASTRKPDTGTRLIREWNGATHVVDVVDGGYLWNGERHRSLSAIALAITGTQWSGPRFFGLRSRAKP